LLKGEILYIL